MGVSKSKLSRLHPRFLNVKFDQESTTNYDDQDLDVRLDDEILLTFIEVSSTNVMDLICKKTIVNVLSSILVRRLKIDGLTRTIYNVSYYVEG